MKVRFWGTRGSIPVALTGDGIRGKLIAALSEARRLEMLTRESEALEIFSACDGLVIEL
jgi:hypothetical protein